MALPSVMTDEILKRLGKLLKDELVLQWSLKDELKKLKIKLVAIKEVLHDAENRELQDPTVRKWLDELRDIMYDTEDIIDDFSLHIHHSPSSTTSALTRSRGIVSKKVRAIFYYRVIGKRIRGVNDRLQQIQKDRQQLQLVQTVRIEGSSLPPRTPIFKRPETTSYVIESEIIGIDEATERLVQLLTGSNNRGGGGRVFAIAGMGGIGKTTLAQKVFNKCDFDNKIWLCLSQDYSEADVLKQIIWSAGGECGKAQTKQDLYSIMNKVLAGRQFLLVLDDLWSNGIWEDCLRIPFNCFTAESRVLITTRNEEIARQMGAVYIHKMQGLSDDDDAWSLLCKVLHQGGDMANIDENMKEVGMKIIKKCKGLPLAIKVIGGVLNKRERTRIAWEIILSSTIWSNLSSEVMPALLLSYMDLPSYLKPCFLYCSLFPEDYEISRYSLTRMWIAEGFVKTEEELSMTDLAEAYHQELITRSLLQVVDVSIIGSFFVKDMKCKMHDLVREMAISLTRGEHIFQCLRQHSERTFLKPRRLSIISNAGDEVVKELKETPLRSLLVFNDSISKISRDIFENIKYLRVLDLHATSIKQLPDSIGKLVHLRYLDLSRTQITELPDSLCKLKYLQTLLLVKCGDLTKLPKDFRHLQRLRHLNVRHKDKDVMMPEGIGELVHLQTLKVFTIHSNNSSHYNSVGAGLHDDEDNGCNINELGSLSQLKCLKIRGLERLRSGSEARKAMMQDKIHLRSLKLMWDSEGAAEGEKKKMEEVFEALPPPPFLQVLWIKGFPGQELPNWMIKSTGKFLQNLIYLELYSINYLQRLSSLAHLPQLKELHVVDNNNIVVIGPEFMFEGGGRKVGGFPKLEVLSFYYMYGWEEWRDTMEGEEYDEEDNSVPKICDAEGVGERSLNILPCLRSLELEWCEKLRSIPVDLLRHATNLTYLSLYRVYVQAIGGLVHVKELSLYACDKLESIWDLPALESLTVIRCNGLKDMTNLAAASLNRIFFCLFSLYGRRHFPNNNMEALRGVRVTAKTSLDIEGPVELLRQCMQEEDGPYWPIIQRFPHVQAKDQSGNFFSIRRVNQSP